jgi:hypothetical protein
MTDDEALRSSSADRSGRRVQLPDAKDDQMAAETPKWRVEFRGGPLNSEVREFDSSHDVPAEIELEYVDANLQGRSPLQRIGHYRLSVNRVHMLWHVDHAKGAGTPIDIDAPETGFESHVRPTEDRAAGRGRR